MKTNNQRIATTIIVCLLLTSCQTSSKSKSYSPSAQEHFHVMSDTELHGQMRSMVPELRLLLDLYLDTDHTEPERKSLALTSLRRIHDIAESIGGENTTTNFSVINEYMGAFLYDVGVAEEFIERKPANYFPAGTLIKSCLACHQAL